MATLSIFSVWAKSQSAEWTATQGQGDKETSPSAATGLAAGSSRLISCINFDDDADDDDTDWCAWNILIETMLLEVSLLLHICNPYPISNIQASTGPSTYRVSHNWVFTLFWLFSRLPVLVQMFILPFFNSPGDDNSKTHLTFWYIQSLSKLYLNPICLTFCSVTWSIFDVGRKVRWVLESSSPGLLKNGKILLCKSSGSWENNQNKVNTQLWDTLYVCNQGPGTEMQTHLLMMVCRLQLWWYQSGTICWIHSPLCQVCPRWSSAQQLVVFTIIYR